MLNKLKEKFVLLVLMFVAVGFFTWVQMKWKTCPVIDCSHNLIDNFLRTIGPGSIYLIGYFTIFLFLPDHYFKSWLRYVFSWGFPLVVYLTYITTGSSSIPAYGKEDVVRFWGVAFAVITLLFIAYRFVRLRKKKST